MNLCAWAPLLRDGDGDLTFKVVVGVERVALMRWPCRVPLMQCLVYQELTVNLLAVHEVDEASEGMMMVKTRITGVKLGLKDAQQ